MKARAGSEIILIKGKEYEVPLGTEFFKSPNGSIMYLVGTHLRDNLNGVGRHYAGVVKNVVSGKYVELMLQTIENQMTDMFVIKNVDGIEYHIPIEHVKGANNLINEFKKYEGSSKAIFKFRYQKYEAEKLKKTC